MRDPYGLELTTTEPAAGLFCEALERLLSIEDGAEELLAAALATDPRFALAHALSATIVAERSGDPDAVCAHLRAARAGARRATEREASFVAAAGTWCTGGAPRDIDLLRHVRSWPTDAYALSLLTPSIASAGVGDGVVEVWALLDEVAPRYPRHDWWLDSIRAFARTEQSRWCEAEVLAAAALEVRPGSGHAAHAVAHVWYETGRHTETVTWLDRWMEGPGRAQTYRGHFSWHAALAELTTGDPAAAGRRFDRELAGLVGNRALIDAGSLLVRAEAHGHSLGPERAAAVALAAGCAATAPTSPFLAWHAALLAGLQDNRSRLAALGELACRGVRAGGPASASWRLVGSVCRASEAILDADYGRAAALLCSLGDTRGLGGSPAQREVLEDLALRCLADAGEDDAAARWAADRLRRRPTAFDLELSARA